MSELNTTSERKKWYTDKIYTCHLNCALCKRAKQKHASFFNLFCFLVCRQASRRGAPGVPLSRREVKERVRRAGTKQARRIHQQLEGRKKQPGYLVRRRHCLPGAGRLPTAAPGRRRAFAERLRLGYCTREGENFTTASRGRSVATVGGMMIANHSSTIPCPAARRQPP